MKKSSLAVVGVLLVVTGAVFTLQGLGHLAGSPMTGARQWAVIGPVLALVGLALVVRSVRNGSRRGR